MKPAFPSFLESLFSIKKSLSCISHTLLRLLVPLKQPVRTYLEYKDFACPYQAGSVCWDLELQGCSQDTRTLTDLIKIAHDIQCVLDTVHTTPHTHGMVS